MRLLNTVIYTDKLSTVREFYEKHFQLPIEDKESDRFGLLWFGEARVTYIDAATAGMSPSQGTVLQIGMPFPALERERLVTQGVNCTDLKVESWGQFFGNAVQYFAFADPSGAQIQMFADHYGEEKQLMTTGDGTETRKVAHG